jgi:rare lipoprotein A
MQRRARVYQLLFTAAGLALTACQPTSPPPSATVSAPAPEPARIALPQTSACDEAFRQEGVATWYGRRHHGRRTANGERFDMNAMTAAHRSLPFGTQIRVTNLDTGEVAELRVNDRGPYSRGRILDVSRQAAQQLGFGGDDGKAQVRIEAIPEDCTRAASVAPTE